MTMLGDLFRDLPRAAALLDDELLAAIARRGESPALFAKAAVLGFERDASPEDWATLVSRVQGAADPGRTCLEIMVRRRLRTLAVAPQVEQEDV
jgi:hypothetical protein